MYLTEAACRYHFVLVSFNLIIKLFCSDSRNISYDKFPHGQSITHIVYSNDFFFSRDRLLNRCFSNSRKKYHFKLWHFGSRHAMIVKSVFHAYLISISFSCLWFLIDTVLCFYGQKKLTSLSKILLRFVSSSEGSFLFTPTLHNYNSCLKIHIFTFSLPILRNHKFKTIFNLFPKSTNYENINNEQNWKKHYNLIGDVSFPSLKALSVKNKVTFDPRDNRWFFSGKKSVDSPTFLYLILTFQNVSYHIAKISTPFDMPHWRRYLRQTWCKWPKFKFVELGTMFKVFYAQIWSSAAILKFPLHLSTPFNFNRCFPHLPHSPLSNPRSKIEPSLETQGFSTIFSHKAQYGKAMAFTPLYKWKLFSRTQCFFGREKKKWAWKRFLHIFHFFHGQKK